MTKPAFETTLGTPLGLATVRLLDKLRAAEIIGKVSLGLFAQALLSAFHFFLNVYLIRSLDPSAYGTFALAFVVGLMGTAVSNALASMPLSVYTSGLTRRAPRVFLETLLSTVNVLVVLVIALVGFIFAICLDLSVASAIACTAFISAFTARQFSRSFSFARRRPVIAVYADVTYIAVGGIALLVAVMQPQPLSLTMVFCILAASNMAAMLLELYILRTGSRLILRWRSLKHYAAIWQDVRWALVGAISTNLQGHSHSILVTLSAGPAAYAPLAAGFVLFGPIRVGLQAWQNIMRPELAIAISKRDQLAIRRTVNISTLLILLGVAIIGLTITACWKTIFELLYANKYENDLMAKIVLGWGVVTACLAIWVAPSGALQCFKEFHRVAYANIYGAIISFISVAGILMFLPIEMSLIGIALAEIFVVVYFIKLLKWRLSRPW